MKPERPHVRGPGASGSVTVAIVHYHLRPGGVSSVIRRHSAALSKMGIRHVILVGERPADAAEFPIGVVETLNYGGSAAAPEVDLALLKNAAIEQLGDPPDVWHFHNPTLRKN